MRYVYGPIPSRRLGQSLGIDPVPLKTCNWNCVYCQLGRTVPLTNERKEYFPREEILAEVEQPGNLEPCGGPVVAVARGKVSLPLVHPHGHQPGLHVVEEFVPG